MVVRGANTSASGSASADLPDDMIEFIGPPGRRLAFSPELATRLKECFQANALPSEFGPSWAHLGRSIDLSCYRSYPGDSSE